MKNNGKDQIITFSFSRAFLKKIYYFFEQRATMFLLVLLSIISITAFVYYLSNGLGLKYNDARSHLDIGRRVVENLKPGFSQLGSVWLPLPHLLETLTIWNDFMWHSGLAGALTSMISFVATGVLIYHFLKTLGVGMFGRVIGVAVFVANINILYMQSTAMTELLLLVTMTAGVYELLLWEKTDELYHLIASSFWIMLATLTRYDGWFLFLYVAALVVIHMLRKRGYKAAEGMFFFFCTLAGFGIVLWFLWNLIIFKDPLYFAFGPYSAHAQQEQLASASALPTKGHLFLSLKYYFYALAYTSNIVTLLFGMIGAIVLWCDKKVSGTIKIVSTALFVPFAFNVIALYLGHSVLFIQGLSGDTWFNIRYGLMMMPSLALFIGYLVHSQKSLRYVIVGLLLFVSFFTFANYDAVTIDDARVGASQKNVSDVSGWLNIHAKNTPGYILISAASHDAIIFSSGLPMARFIHEGTGTYWKSATKSPDRWARWIIMRTNDVNDQTFKLIKGTTALAKYDKKGSFPFADIYELKPQYVSQLHFERISPGK
jgi:hypothetical protein